MQVLFLNECVDLGALQTLREQHPHGFANSVVDPAEGADDVGGEPWGKTKKAIKWEMKGSREAGWREASGRREERRKKSQGKDPKTSQENRQGRDPVRTQGPLKKIRRRR